MVNEIKGFEEQVTIHVSDNCSNDGTHEFLKHIKHPSISFSRNTENIGLGQNVLKCHEFTSTAEFTWAVGDDDIILSSCISELLNSIRSFPDIDFYFLNTVSYNEEKKNKYLKLLKSNNYKVIKRWGPTKSRIHKDFQCSLKEIFNPKIDSGLLGSLMCYAWRSSLVNNQILTNELSKDFSKPKAIYHVALNYLYCLKPSTKCFHFSRPFTVNFWHYGLDWGNKGYDLAVTQGLGIILYEAIRLGFVDEKKRVTYFNHYMGIALPSYKRLISDNGSKFQHELVEFVPKLAEMLLLYGNSGTHTLTNDLVAKISNMSVRTVYLKLIKLFNRTL